MSARTVPTLGFWYAAAGSVWRWPPTRWPAFARLTSAASMRPRLAASTTTRMSWRWEHAFYRRKLRYESWTGGWQHRLPAGVMSVAWKKWRRLSARTELPRLRPRRADARSTWGTWGLEKRRL